MPGSPRTIEQLVDRNEPAITLIRKWVESAVKQCEILPPSEERDEVLLELQVTTHSTMGAVAYETGGVLIDNGWLRFPGSGNPKLPRTLTEWNRSRSEGFYLFADDAVGGFFAINGGALGSDFNNVYYWAPDNLEWEPLDVGYTDFFQWALSTKLDAFYADLRWPTWQTDIESIGGDQCFSFVPFLWARGDPLDQRSRRPIPVAEAFDLKKDIVRQHKESDAEYERQLLANIDKHGWHIVGIDADSEGPAYAFSVGIYRTLGQPELCIFGLEDWDTMGKILNVVGDVMRSGKQFDNWHESDDVLEGYNCMFRLVDPGFYGQYMGYARWYHDGDEFPMLQIVWPDRNMNYPWDSDFLPSLVDRQPVLAAQSDWPFSAGTNRAVFTTRLVLEEGHPILIVTHDDDDDWQFVCGTTDDPADGRLVSLGCIVEAHPEVKELADLPLGWRALRESPEQPWHRTTNCE